MSSPISPQDYTAALALLAAVKYTKDDEDKERFLSCWSKNARLEIESNGQTAAQVKGRDAILEFYQQVWAAGGHGKGSARETHIAEYPDVIPVADGRLLARHNSSFFYADQGDILVRGFGTFRDLLTFEDGAWRIDERHSTLVRRD